MIINSPLNINFQRILSFNKLLLTFSTLNTAVLFMTRVNHRMQAELFFPFESFQAVTQIRSFRVVRLLMARQMIFPFQRCITDFAHEPTLHVLVSDHVLVEDFSTNWFKFCNKVEISQIWSNYFSGYATWHSGQTKSIDPSSANFNLISPAFGLGFFSFGAAWE